MSFSRHLVAAFLIDGAAVEIAVRALVRDDLTTRFSNDAAGVRGFVEWLDKERLLDGETRLHVCLATTGAPDAMFESPFVEFAYDSADNAFVWPPDQLARAAGPSVPTARAMLDHCVEQHHATAIA
ncbi:hypothetical protein BH09PSE6_BH09PSE6_34360 [soil metagenome]